MHPNSRRLSDLRFERNQRLQWAGYFSRLGRKGDAEKQKKAAARLAKQIESLTD